MKLTKLFFTCFLWLFVAIASAQSIEKWKIDRLENYISKSDRPLIINFWATFCKPCVEEIPYFQELVKKYKQEGKTSKIKQTKHIS